MPTSTPPPLIPLDWYFDFISPFAYLQFEQFDHLPAGLSITFRPVLLGALLAHWESKGPAEIVPKRRFTYRYAQFRAEQLGIPFRLPAAHPFNPLTLLRLAIAAGCTQSVIREIFRFVWRDGGDPASTGDVQALAARLGVADLALATARPEVKAQLRQNTEQAIALGVFGVPTFVLGTDLFWGEDATPMLLHCIASPAWLQSDEVRRISDLPVGVQREIRGDALN
jgi:2-hydroxychromene-2-carboxylate isomerase